MHPKMLLESLEKSGQGFLTHIESFFKFIVITFYLHQTHSLF
jgi:hypothetical protein